MALIYNVEVCPQKEEKLQDFLFTEIKNQAKWRNNRSDTINDQTGFYESYFGKSSFIDKSTMAKLLKESEKFHAQCLNHNNVNKTKFLEIITNTSKYDFNNILDQTLFSFDNDDKELQIFDFSVNQNNIPDLEDGILLKFSSMTFRNISFL